MHEALILVSDWKTGVGAFALLRATPEGNKCRCPLAGQSALMTEDAATAAIEASEGCEIPSGSFAATGRTTKLAKLAKGPACIARKAPATHACRRLSAHSKKGAAAQSAAAPLRGIGFTVQDSLSKIEMLLRLYLTGKEPQICV